MIKILYILNDFEDISLNHNAFKIADSLPRDKFTPYILTLRNKGSLKGRFLTTFSHGIFISNKSFFNSIFQTTEIIKKYGIGIVHTQTLRADYTLFFAKMLNWFQKSFRGIYQTGRPVGIWSGFRLPRRPSTRSTNAQGRDEHVECATSSGLLAMTKNTRIFHAANRRNYFFLTCEPNFLFKNILYFISCHLADFNICVANHLQYKLVNKLMVPKQKVVTISNGVKPRNIDSSRKHSSGIPLITFTGKLIKRKNVLCLLKALSQITLPYKCFIIGDGPEKQKLEEFAKTQKLGSKVRFQPFTPNVSRFLAKTDIFVLPSLAEGMSMSLLEAMSFGIACVVSDIDANTELIKHMEEGLVVPRNDPKTLADRVKLLLKNSNLRKKLGMKAYSKIKKSYDQRESLKQYQELLR